MAIIQFKPQAGGGVGPEGYRIPRGSQLFSLLVRGQQTRCQFSTAHHVDLLPIELSDARYFGTPAELANAGVRVSGRERAGISIRLRTTGGEMFQELAVDGIPFHLTGGGALPVEICEQLIANSARVVVRPVREKNQWSESLPKTSISQIGFADDEALLPVTGRSLTAYRLLQEYFALPQRFLFVRFEKLAPVLARCDCSEIELVVMLDRVNERLRDLLSKANFQLFCSPAINLFEKRADRIQVRPFETEYHLLADRTRPLDFEIYSVDRVSGIYAGDEHVAEFRPLYDAGHADAGEARSYFVTNREQRLFSSTQKRRGARSSYLGSEVFLSLVGAEGEAVPTDVKQLETVTLCTNRDLPLLMALGSGTTDFDLQSGAPVDSIRCLGEPSRPRSSPTGGSLVWRLTNSLSVNYLSLVDTPRGPEALRELLRLFVDPTRPEQREQLLGLIRVETRPATCRLPTPGPLCFGRGLEVRLTVDESGFEGAGAFLLASVLERFFARYVTLNSFTQTVLRSEQRGEIMRWPPRTGLRPLL